MVSANTFIVLNGGTFTPSPKMIATAIAAILGAVHRDDGAGSLAQVMDRLALTHVLLLPWIRFCLTGSSATHLVH